VRVWGAVTGKELLELQGFMPRVGKVVFSPDGRRLAAACGDQTVRVRDAATGKELLTVRHRGDNGRISSVVYSPDGRRLASAGGGTVRLWDADTGQELLALPGRTKEVYAVAFSPDGRRLASAGDGTVRLWDADTGQELLALPGRTKVVSSIAFSPDGRRLALSDGDELGLSAGMLRIWDATTGEELLNLPGHKKGIFRVSFSPDGQRVASASGDQTVRVWDAATGKDLLVLKGHTDPVYDVAFSPDGRRLASAGDRTVRLWDADSGQELLALKGHMGPVSSVSFSPNGRRLAAAGMNEELDAEKVRIWETSPIPDTVWRQRGLVGQVASLFDELGLREEVLAALRKNPTLCEADREFALQVAQTHSEDSIILNDAAWKVLKVRDAGKNAYARALRQAEAAVRLTPEHGDFLNMLGIAQYRAGRHADALATLTKSEKLQPSKIDEHAAGLALLAMTQHQLGKKDEAKATLGRLREVMKDPFWAQNADAGGVPARGRGVDRGQGGR
jgi:dipeptidyl aminopeptidase/acylaminoacyl peptidase